MLFVEGQDGVVQRVGGGDGRFRPVQPGKAKRAVRIDDALHVNLAHALDRADEISVLTQQVSWVGSFHVLLGIDGTTAMALEQADHPLGQHARIDQLVLHRAPQPAGQAGHRRATGERADRHRPRQCPELRVFELSTHVLAFDTTNFDTHIATTTPGELARRGKAKSKRSDLRVVGLAVLVSETGHVPLLHRTYPGNGSDQAVLGDCLQALGQLHEALDAGESRAGPASRTLVRDGGSWSEQLELDLDVEGYATLISLPLSHQASQEALEYAARRGAMKPLGGKLGEVRAARLHTQVGKLDRTLVVVESQELLRGQKRGIAGALRKAKEELRKLQRVAARGRITRGRLEERVNQALRREHLSEFVITEVPGKGKRLSLDWHVDAARRRHLERTRLGRRVLCTDRHSWTTGRIVYAFRGQWKVEEVFRRAKKGGLVPWGPSYQWADSSLRLHTFATVIGLTLVSLAGLALGTRQSAPRMLKSLAEVQATLVRVGGRGRGRRPTVLLAPDLSAEQRKAVKRFALERWIPGLLLSSSSDASGASATPAA